MRVSMLLIIFPALLANAAPLPDDSVSIEGIAKRGYVPALPYPPGQSATTCPTSGGNFYDSLEQPRRKRSTHHRESTKYAAEALVPRALCGQVAHGNINNFPYANGNTAEHLLIAGATYVFSRAFDEIVQAVRAWRHNADGTYTNVQETGNNQGSGTMTVNVEGGENVNFHFEVVFTEFNIFGVYDATGEFALFQQANGDQNP